MVVKSNKDKLMKQALMGKVAPPVMAASGRSTYVTTWDGKPKIGIGVGGIKYNVKMGDPCLGWPETEYMTPGVALYGVDEKAEYDRRSASGSGTAFTKLSCIGNKVIVVGGDAKGSKGVVTGKGGVGGTSRHVLSNFPRDVLKKLQVLGHVRCDVDSRFDLTPLGGSYGYDARPLPRNLALPCGHDPHCDGALVVALPVGHEGVLAGHQVTEP